MVEFEYQNPSDWQRTIEIADVAGLPGQIEDMNARAAMLQDMIGVLGSRLSALEAGIPPVIVPAPSTVRVTSLADFRSALLDGEPHITVAFRAEGVSVPIRIPRIPDRTIVGAPGAFIGSDGSDFHILKVADGSGGKLSLTGDLTIDGGWLLRPGEASGDQAAQLYAPNMDDLLIEDWTTQFSRRTGFFATGCRNLTLRRVKGYAMPRDFIWSNDSVNVLIEDCDVQHCGDDGIGTHLNPRNNMARNVVIRRNCLRDCLGIKVLGTGTILIEDNVLEACAFYGVRLGKDYTTGEGDVDLRDITVRRNVITDLQQASRCHAGQVYGAGLLLDAQGRRADNVVFDGNKVSWPNRSGRLRDVYPWAGYGFFSKSGFVPDGTMNPASTQHRFVCVNPADVVIR